MQQDFRLQFQAETVIRKLLMNEKWALRSFDVIKHHIGGFEDDELRQLLVRAGAVRFAPKGMEMWGLYERTQHALEGTQGYEKALEPWSAACWIEPILPGPSGASDVRRHGFTP